jgi:hypothetical protein
MSKWNSPLLMAAAAILGGSVVLAEGQENQATFAGAGLATSLLLIGVWINSEFENKQ